MSAEGVAPGTSHAEACGGDCWYEPYGYVWCTPHGEHHRPPVCPVDEQGNPAPWWEDGPDG